MLPQNLLVKVKTVFSLSSRVETLERLVYFLLLLLLPTQLGKHFWPDYAVVSGFRVDYLSPTLYLTDLLLLVLFLFALRRVGKTTPKRVLSSLLPFLLALLFLLLTILQAVSVFAGLYSLLKVAEGLFFAWYTAHLLRDPRLRLLAVRIFALTISGESLLALAQVAAKGSLGGMWYWLGERTVSSLTPGAATVVLQGEVLLRPYGTFSHPNVLAGFLLLGMTYVLFHKASFSSPIAVWLFGSGLVLGSLGLLVTLSRGPILLWGVVLFFTLLRQGVRRFRTHRSLFPVRSFRQRAAFLSVLSLGVVLAVLFGTTVISRFVQTSFHEESFLVRVDLIRIAWVLIQAHPLLGVGLGNFFFHSAPLKSPETPLFFAVQPVHNIFLLVLAETGVLGLVLWLWAFTLSLARAAFSYRIIVGLIILLGLADHYFLTLQQGQLLLAFFLGSCWLTQTARGL